MFAEFLFAVLAALPFAPQLHEGDAIPPTALVDQDGRAFELARLHGRAVVVSFVYTRCTDSCALTAAKLAHIATVADPRAVAVVGITVDPLYDRPARLRRYRGLFETPSRWTLATGEPGTVLLLERRLGVEPESKEPGRTDHAGLVVILDREGRIVRFVPGDDWTSGQVATAARIAGGGPPDLAVTLEFWLSDAIADCGRGTFSLGSGAALALVCALTLAITVPLYRAIGHFRG